MYKQIRYFDGQISTYRVLRIADNTSIPFEPTSIDYQEYLDWIADGNTPLPADE
jgi:hypothetical protein